MPDINRGTHSNPGATLRIAVLDAGGRPYLGVATAQLDGGLRSLSFDKREGAAFVDAKVEPGTYLVSGTSAQLVAPARRVDVPSGLTTVTIYLGERGWPFYRLGASAVPFPPPGDLLAVAFPSGKPGPDVARRHAGDIEQATGLRRFAPPPDEKSPTSRGADNERADFTMAAGAVWLFEFPAASPAASRRDAVARIREIVGGAARVGVPVDVTPGRVKVIDQRFIVRFKDGVDQGTRTRLLRDGGATALRHLRHARGAQVIEFTGSDPLAALAIVETWHARDLLVYGEPEIMAEITDDVFPDTPPSDPTFASQANLTLQQVDVAWRIMQSAGPTLTTGSPTIVVATLDRGLDLDHPDIGGTLTDGTAQVARAFDFSGMREMTVAGYAPDSSHGMGVYGIIAARADNANDIAGIAPNTRQVGLERPDLTSANYPDILLWAAGFTTGNTTSGWPAEPIATPADIISCSHGSDGLALSGLMDDALNELATNGRGGRGTVVIYSAGNSDTLITGFRTWAAHPATLAIANSMQPDGGGVERKDGTSNFGPEIDVCAQGTNAPSLDDVGGEQTFGGTSAAAPTVAGIAALMLSRDATLTRLAVRDTLRATAQQIDLANTDPIGQWVGGFSQWYGFGRVNAAHAVCGAAPAVTLLTPSVNFNSVPEGETTVRAVVLGVESCQPQRFDVVAGPTGPFTLPLGPSVPLEVTADGSREARVWLGYTGTTEGDTANGSVTVRWFETGEEWVVPITADTVRRPTVCLGLVLDQSGSMSASSGLPLLPQRVDVLKFSVPPLIDVLQDTTALGIVSFDTDAFDVMPVTVAGPPVFGAGRSAARDAVLAHTPNPLGMTAIGDGVEKAHDLLAPETTFDIRATIVFTDGHETAAKYVSDVADLVDERVYAIGLGTADQIQPAALTALTAGTGGYLLLTGELGSTDTFLLAKYYLQILAGVANDEIVLDPQGTILPGQRHRIPFVLTDADISCDTILLTSMPKAVRFALETPSGAVITPADAAVLPGMRHVVSDNTAYYRYTLPLPVGAGAAAGTWHAVIAVDDAVFKRELAHADRQQPSRARATRGHGIPYAVNVHAHSNLRMRATLSQDGYEPGARLYLRAALTEYGLPVDRRARVRADVVRPDGTVGRVALQEVAPGIFESTLPTTQAGVYRCTLRATGRTLRQQRFTREFIVTGHVWRGGNQPPPSSPEGGRPVSDICAILRCAIESGAVSRDLVAKLRALGLDLDALRKCCRAVGAPGSPGAEPAPCACADKALVGKLRNLLDGMANP